MKHVYAMQRADGAVKVGISNNPSSRVISVQHEVKQAVVIASYTDARSDADTVEDIAHKLLKAKHDTGEWFWVTPDADDPGWIDVQGSGEGGGAGREYHLQRFTGWRADNP